MKPIKYDNLLFRRQFLLTRNECTLPRFWRKEAIGSYKLCVHPDLAYYAVHDPLQQHHIMLLGYVMNPAEPQLSSIEIIRRIQEQNSLSPDTVARNLYPLSGRFVMIAEIQSRLYVFHDACGLRTVYFSADSDGVHIASQPNLLSLVTDLVKGEKYNEYMTSSYKVQNREHWIPAGVSLFENVDQLVPNHYLDVSTLEQIRYWPTSSIRNLDSGEAVEKVACLLTGSIAAASANFKLALPLTAGWDSRLLLSACRGATDVLYYTLEYRSLLHRSPDVKIPRRLLARLGYDHHLFNCKGKAEDEKFMSIYNSNSDMAHFFDWGEMAYWIEQHYPTERLCLKGSCAEIARCFYYPSGRHREMNTSIDFINLESGWSGLQFIHNAISEWQKKSTATAVGSGVDMLDLFYWEHRMGGWQAQSQLEWDIAIEQYTPFNNRQLLEILLGVDPHDRCSPKYTLFKDVIISLWPDVLNEPINPSIKNSLKIALRQLGVLDPLRTRWNKLKARRKS